MPDEDAARQGIITPVTAADRVNAAADGAGGSEEREGDEAMPRNHGAITQLALIQSYDPTSGVVSEITPVAPEDIAAIAEAGYDIVTSITGHDPYTHVITTGVHDYLAALLLPGDVDL